MFHASDCLLPKGRLNPAALWPGVSLSLVSANLEEYLADGYERAPGLDEAARVWAYHRAYDEKYQERSALPSTVAVGDEGSSGYTQAQIDSWRTLSLEALDEFDELVAEATGEEASSYDVIRSLR